MHAHCSGVLSTHWGARDTHQIDAISVLSAVWDVSPKLRSTGGVNVAIWHNFDVACHELGGAEARPTVFLSFSTPFLEGAVDRRSEHLEPTHRVVKWGYSSSVHFIKEQNIGSSVKTIGLRVAGINGITAYCIGLHNTLSWSRNRRGKKRLGIQNVKSANFAN